MDYFETLNRFAERGLSSWPVLSVYVNTRPIGPQMATYRPYFKKRMVEELKRFPARSPEHESLAVDFSRAQHFLDYELKGETRAAAVFSSYADDDLFVPIQVSREFSDPLVTVGPLPTLFPLIRMADRYARTAVVLSDSNTARLFVMGLGAVELRREVRSEALHKSKQAGENDPAALQHKVEEAWRKHARQTVHVLEEIVRETPVTWIVIAGEEAIAAALATNLSPALREKLLPRQSWDVRISEADLAGHVDALVEEREKDRRKKRASGLVERSGAGGSVLGVAPVVEALRGSRVKSLVMSEALTAENPAWSCPNCHAFDAGKALDTCPQCGASAVRAVPLREELAARALRVGATVHFVEGRADAAFDERGGIGAELRY